MINIYNDIEVASNLIKNKREANLSRMFDDIYPFSNENLTECLKDVDLEEKSCLTVLGSSDQTLDMILKGAKNITTFDINQLTIHYYELKKAGINLLSKEDYLYFFALDENITYKHAFNKDVYKYISRKLPINSLLFWNVLFDRFDKKDIREFLFSYDEPAKTSLSKTINYLRDNNYYELKEKINNINLTFINTNICNLPKKLNETYDFMYLSNIMGYAKDIYVSDNLDKSEKIRYALQKYKELILKLDKNLNDKGKIMVDYIFNINNSSETLDIQKNIRNEIFYEDVFSYKVFKEDTDGCLIYTKK